MKADQDQVQINPKKPVLGTALQFVVLMGLVSLLADVTYEGARSAIGPFLALLGASGAVVGFYSGLGELLGYSLRMFTGFLSDRTGRYWLITITGYCVNLLAVPLLALAGRWEVAVALVIAERVGKAIRTPARDAMLSHATSQLGQGWGFGLHEALDQIGAVLGPLVLAGILFMKSGTIARLGDYQIGFAFLLIPALLAIGVLLLAYNLFPKPRDLEVKRPQLKPEGFNRNYWLYLAAVALVAAGYADFPLIAFHFGKVALMPAGWIPLCYAIAMGVDALAALLFGRWFDRRGVAVMAVAVLGSALFAPLVFLGNFQMALIGIVLWGIGMGAQESIMRAAIATMIPAEKRGSGYGIFNTGFGICWFLGSALMGRLYDISLTYLIGFSVLTQLLAVPLFLSVRKQQT